MECLIFTDVRPGKLGRSPSPDKIFCKLAYLVHGVKIVKSTGYMFCVQLSTALKLGR